MKIRTNYVSNSSSSSFIVSYDRNAKEILTSMNGTKIEIKPQFLIDELEKMYETHSECTMMIRQGSSAIYNDAKEWWDEECLKELKNFLDKNPEHCKAEFQINYDDKNIKKCY
jgi:hypothetical protein